MPEPVPTMATPATEARPARSRRGGFWREISGAVALGVAALAVVVLALQVVAWLRGVPGPGLGALGAHIAAAVVAGLVQRVADRRGGWVRAAAVLGVLVLTGTVLWLFWWA